jgi:NitT/TauT family transport system substrate-binding protein
MKQSYRRPTRSARSWVVALLLMPLLTALPARAEITLGVNDWVGYVAWYIAQEKGFFKKNGTEVKLVWCDSVVDSLDKFAAGKLDANAQPWTDTLMHVAQKVPLKTIMVTLHSAGADALMVGPGIKRLSDLKGKKIALEEVAIMQFMVETALKKAGLIEKDVQVMYMPAGDAAKAFMDGKVDAAAVWNPFVNEIQVSGKGRPLFSSKDVPGMMSDVLVVSEKSLKQKRAEFVGLVRTWYDVEKFLQTNRDEAIKIMAKVVKQEPDKYRIFLSGARFLGEKDNLESFGPASNPRSLPSVSTVLTKFLTDKKLITGQVNLASAIDDSLVKEIAKR